MVNVKHIANMAMMLTLAISVGACALPTANSGVDYGDITYQPAPASNTGAIHVLEGNMVW